MYLRGLSLRRHQSKDGDRSAPTPSPIPDSLSRRFKETLNLGPDRRRKDRAGGAGKIVYASDSISRWWPVGDSSNEDPIPASIRLEPFDCEILERKEGEKPLVLVGGGGLEAAGAAEGQDIPPWVSIAKRLVPDLISAAVSARNDLKRDGNEEGKLFFVARPGKNLFHGPPSPSSDSQKVPHPAKKTKAFFDDKLLLRILYHDIRTTKSSLEKKWEVALMVK